MFDFLHSISFKTLRVLRRLMCGHECCICHGVLPLFSAAPYPLCRVCFDNLEYIKGPCCAYCGFPLISEEVYCLRCRERPQFHNGSASLFYYDSKEYTFLELYKFEYRKEFSYLFADLLSDVISRDYPEHLVIAVPSNPLSIQKRGWGHMETVLKILRNYSVQTAPDILVRKKGRTQKKLSKDQRLSAMKGNILFGSGSLPADRNILLIDDVFTTGATLDVCAELIHTVSDMRINCLTLFRD